MLFLVLSFGTLYRIPLGGSFYDLKFVELFLIMLFLLVCVKMWRNKTPIYGKTSTFLYYGFWFSCVIYALLAYFWTEQGLAVIAGTVVLVYGLIAFATADHFFSKNHMVYVTANRLLIVSLFIQLVISMSESFGAYGLSFYALKEQSNTLIGNSNYMSFYFSFVLLYEMIAKEKRWLPYTLIGLIGVMLTISRGAIVTIAICLVIYFFVVLFNRNFKKFGAIVSMVVLAIGFYIFVTYTAPGTELWFGLTQGSNASSVGTRQLLWDSTLSQINSMPFGSGLYWQDDPHNVVLKSIRDLGVLFGVVFIMLIAYPLFNFLKFSIFRYSPKTIAILIAYLSVFIHSLIEVFYFTSTSIIWVAFTLSFLNKALQVEKAERREKVKSQEAKKPLEQTA